MAAPWTSAWTMATRRVDSVTIIVLLLMPLQVLLLSGGGEILVVRGICQLVGRGGEIYFFLFRKLIPYKTNYLGHERFFNCSK